jgi:hypothetical protein
MVYRVLNVANREIPITVMVVDNFNKRRYPGTIIHKGTSFDFAQWGLANVNYIWQLLWSLLFSDNFIREYLAGDLVLIGFVP